MTLYESGNVVKELLFRAKDSQWSSWFHRSWLVNSSWSDLHSEQTNKFTFRGHCVGHGCRYVYINRSFGGCPYDLGWIMYTDLKACAYEHGPLSSAIHYSKLETYAHWGNVGKVLQGTNIRKIVVFFCQCKIIPPPPSSNLLSLPCVLIMVKFDL